METTHQRRPAERHYGLDWLRIAAFALLIVYHVAMVFSPWDWVVKWPASYPALVAPMALLTPWRLPLLFVVSGFATRRLLDRSPSFTAFAKSRSARLLVPVAVAMVFLLPPELWVRVREVGYPWSLTRYWLTDYWNPVSAYGIAFPSWEHLWFVVYLWAYTMCLGAIVARVGRGAIQRRYDALARGRRLLWIPVAILVLAKLTLMFVVPERQGLTTDWAGHAEYFPLFVFGWALGGSESLWKAITRNRHLAILLSAAGGAIVVGIELAYQGHHVPGHAIMALDRASRLAMAWGTILVLLHVADRWWNRDHRWRGTLGEAVFPAYIIHHPVLIVLTWNILPLKLGAVAGFVMLLSGTAAACFAYYTIGRDIAWIRPLIGLSKTPQLAKPPVPVRARIG